MKKFVHVLKEKLNQGSSQDYVRQQQTPYNHPSQATLLPISGFILNEKFQPNALMLGDKHPQNFFMQYLKA